MKKDRKKLIELIRNVVPIVHGRWEIVNEDCYGSLIVKCSSCHEEWIFEVGDDMKELKYNYCPNCGAKMDGGENEH